MLLLTNTTHILQLVTSSSSSLDWTVSYVDITATTFTPGSDQGNIAAATTTTITSAPAASTQRQIKQITLHNAGGSANTVTVVKDISGTEYKVFPATTLAAGESLVYQDGGGWTYFDSTGSPQTTRKAAGNTTEVQYNNSGVLAGSSNLTYDSGTNTLGLTGTNAGQNFTAITNVPSNTSANVLRKFNRNISGRSLPCWRDSTGSVPYVTQPALFGNHQVVWFPQTTSGTWYGSIFTAVAAGAAVLPTTTNLYTAMRRATFTVATGINLQNSIRSENMFFRGAAAGQGGFFFHCRFGFNTWTATNRLFVGLCADTTAIVTANPSSKLNLVGFGVDTGDTAITFMANDGAGTATKTAISSTVLATNQGYDAYIYCKPNDTVVYYRLDNLLTGAILCDTSVNTDLPVNTTLLNAHAAIGSGATNAGAGVAVLGVNKMYIETDY
jgi:hypothetical protein